MELLWEQEIGESRDKMYVCRVHVMNCKLYVWCGRKLDTPRGGLTFQNKLGEQDSDI